MSHNLCNCNKKHRLSDARNTRKINTFFSSNNQVKYWNYRSMNKVNVDHWAQIQWKTLSQSESRQSSIESQFTHVAESETWFKLCMLTLCLKIRSRPAKYLTVNFPLYQCFFPNLPASGPFSYPYKKNKNMHTILPWDYLHYEVLHFYRSGPCYTFIQTLDIFWTKYWISGPLLFQWI